MAHGDPQLWFDGIVWLDFLGTGQANGWAMAPEDWLHTPGKALEITAELDVILASGTLARLNVDMFLKRTAMVTDRATAPGVFPDYWQSIVGKANPNDPLVNITQTTVGRTIVQAEFGPFNTTDRQPGALLRVELVNNDNGGGANNIVCVHLRIWANVKE